MDVHTIEDLCIRRAPLPLYGSSNSLLLGRPVLNLSLPHFLGGGIVGRGTDSGSLLLRRPVLNLGLLNFLIAGVIDRGDLSERCNWLGHLKVDRGDLSERCNWLSHLTAGGGSGMDGSTPSPFRWCHVGHILL